MIEILNSILDNARIAYKESVLIDNEIIEEQLLSIMTSTKILLNEMKSNTDLNKPKIKDTVNNESDEIDRIKRRVPLWITRQHQYNYKILATFMKLSENNKFSIDVSLLEKHSGINDIVRFTSHFNQMKSSSPKSHGKIFIENNKQIKLWEPIKDFITSKF